MTEGPYGGQDSRPEDHEPLEDNSQAVENISGWKSVIGRGFGQEGAVGGRSGQESTAQPEGDTYAWYRRGVELLGKHSPAAAAQLLERAADAEPASRMVREALARAQFDAGWYELAVQNFRKIVEASPADDYAHFGLGLALARCGDPGHAAEYLALAAAMRPDLPHYSAALRDVRATLRARADTSDPDGLSRDATATDAASTRGPDAGGPGRDDLGTDGPGTPAVGS